MISFCTIHNFDINIKICNTNHGHKKYFGVSFSLVHLLSHVFMIKAGLALGLIMQYLSKAMGWCLILVRHSIFLKQECYMK